MRKGAVAREGYKKTELGWIPEDWEVKRLGELAEVYSGGTPPTAISEYYGGEILWINSGDLNKTKIFSVEGRITELGLRNSSAKIIQPETLLIALYGATAGVVAISKIEAAINQAVLAIIPRRDFVYFLLHQLIYLQEFIKRTYKQGGQANLSGELVKSCPLVLPPLPEQKKSAEILSTWDEAIEKLNSYIEAKKKLKKALMRRLLTGKQRFKEFIVREGYKKTELGWIPEDWEVRRLGESCELLKDGTHSSHIDVEPSQGLPLLSAKDINNGKIFFSQESRHISEVDFKQIHKSYFLSDGDILLTIVASIGRVAVVENYERNYTIQRSIAVIRLRKQFYNYFYFYFFQCLYFQKELIQRSNASAQAGVYLGELSKIKIPLPPLPEQKKIAEILSKADEEIDLLNQELEKLKTQKKGLMQKLLTGAWRVKL